MKIINNKQGMKKRVMAVIISMVCFGAAMAQDSLPAEPTPAAGKKIAKNTFESIWIIDNQTVMVPNKKSFEMDINHRFGTWNKGYEDFWGFFSPSNIKLAFTYVPINKLMAGVSITKSNMTWEAYAKYSILKQTKDNSMPLSASWYSNMAIETRAKDFYKNGSDRLSYFHQLLIARKITKKISIQVAPSLTHVNFVYGQFTDDSTVKGGRFAERKHDHFAIAFSGRYRIKEGMGLLFNYDQPVTKHKTGNPNPNLSFGLELTTSSHAFQIFFGNFPYMTPQRNNYFNPNNYKENQYLLGFNITRLWNY